MTRKTGDPAPKKPGSDSNTLADKLARLGIAREEDLVLHLPLRYEDHTRLVPLARVKVGETLQTEGTVVNVDIQYRPRRQLVCLLEDGPDGDARARSPCAASPGQDPRWWGTPASGDPRAACRRAPP